MHRPRCPIRIGALSNALVDKSFAVPVSLSFSGLAPSTWYLGQVVYGNPAEIGTTIVNVK